MSDEKDAGNQFQQALAFQQSGELQKAADLCQHRIAKDPHHHDALHLLGIVAHQAGQNELAAALVRQAISIRPDLSHFHGNLAYILTALKQLDDAVASAREGLRLDPRNTGAMINLGNALKELGSIEASIDAFRAVCDLQPDYWHAHSNFLYAHHYATGRSQADVFELHRRFARMLEGPDRVTRPWQAQDADPGRKLRIGYLSPDLREHPVAYFLEPVLAHHDKSRFEVTCYHDHVQSDAFTQRLAALSDHWVATRALSDDALTARILEDRIDVLVDLAGHTADNRLAVFARKPAPVQMTWLGYVGSTGLSSMDWRLTHADADPPGNEQYYSEKLYRFERSSWWVYRPRPDMPEVSASPALRQGFITFGSTNNIGKLNLDALTAWAEILREVQPSRLVLAGIPAGSAQDRIRLAFVEKGVAAERVIMVGKLAPQQFWALHAELDLLLDPFPYNGGTTSCDALWLGVPLVALQGQAFVSRMGHALLRSLDLAELSAGSIGEYTKVAIALGRDPRRLAAIRAGLRERMSASGLRDEAGFTRELEQAMRMAWREWCTGGTAAPIGSPAAHAGSGAAPP